MDRLTILYMPRALKHLLAREGEYNPFEHRDYTHAVSNWGIVMHLFKSAVGAGMLSMPKAFWGTGWFFGIFLTAFLGGICSLTLYGLVETAREQCVRCRVPLLDYGSTAEHTLLNGPACLHRFAHTVKVVVNSLLLFLYIGVCTVYVMSIAAQAKQLYECQSPEIEKTTDISIKVYVSIFAVVFVAALQFRDLKTIAPLSAIANVAYLIVIITVLVFVFNTPLPSLTSLPPIAPLDRLPMSASIIVLAIENVGSVLPLENSTKTPEDYLGLFGVFACSMAGIVGLYILMGFFPYWRYGEATAVVISFNLDQRDTSALVVKSLVVVTIMASYTLNGYVATDLLATITKSSVENFTKDATKRTIIKTLIRAALSLTTVVLAILIPNLGAIMGLTGALLLSTLGICIPSALELITFWKQGRYYMLRRVKCFAILAIYTLILVFGVYDALLALMSDSQKSRCPGRPEALPRNATRRMMFTILDV